jgi:hypothetical protein
VNDTERRKKIARMLRELQTAPDGIHDGPRALRTAEQMATELLRLDRSLKLAGESPMDFIKVVDAVARAEGFLDGSDQPAAYVREGLADPRSRLKKMSDSRAAAVTDEFLGRQAPGTNGTGVQLSLGPTRAAAVAEEFLETVHRGRGPAAPAALPAGRAERRRLARSIGLSSAAALDRVEARVRDDDARQRQNADDFVGQAAPGENGDEYGALMARAAKALEALRGGRRNHDPRMAFILSTLRTANARQLSGEELTSLEVAVAALEKLARGGASRDPEPVEEQPPMYG